MQLKRKLGMHRIFYLKKVAGHRHSHGAAIVESMLSMMVLLLILFGLLQLFQISLARVFAEFAAFRGARSAAVGFNSFLAQREARIHAIPASGPMTEPVPSAELSSSQAQFAFEKEAIERYMDGTQWLNYQYWGAGGDYSQKIHTNYHCPYYGTLQSGAGCKCDDEGTPSLTQSLIRNAETVRVDCAFSNYPLIMPLRDAFLSDNKMNIGSTVTLTNHAASFLGDD